MTSDRNGPQFNVSASVIASLGEGVAPDESTTIVELIKNAFDADAEWINIEIDTQHSATIDKLHFKPSSIGFIKIVDNGAGMSWEDVQRNWLNFSFSDKKRFKAESTTEKFRTPVGGRGVGRLGTIRLGRHVELFTLSRKENNLNHIAIDWDQFSEEKHISENPLFSEQLPGLCPIGTSIYIFPLRNLDAWKGEALAEMVTSLVNKLLPFFDKSSFRVNVKVDGREILGMPSRDKKETATRLNIENVWQKMSPNLIREVITFWDTNKMIKPGFSSEERARQVVLILRDTRSKAIVGLSTAGVVTFKQLNSNNFYLYRSIILPGYRHPGLTSKIIVETRDLLEAYNQNEGNNLCKGILTFVENPRIQQFRREAIWPASKMVYIGMDKEGRHIRVYYFKGATI